MGQYFDVQRAKADGMSDDEINRIMTQMKLKPKPAEPTTKPQNTTDSGMGVDQALYQEPTQSKEPGLLSKIGGGLMDVGRAIFKAPARLGRALGTDVKENEKTKDQLVKSAEDNARKAMELQKAGKNEDAMRFYKLAQDSLKLAGEHEEVNITTKEEKNQELKKGAVGTAAFLVPGGGATMAGKVAAGALTGAAAGYGASGEGEGAESALAGAAIGGAVPVVAGAVKGVWGLLTKGKQSNIFSRAGDLLREDASKIRMKPSVYGAKQEKEIVKTLNDLGINGSPQKKYTLLEPKMNDLGKNIRDTLQSDSKQIDVQKVVTQFKDGLKSTMRTGELTSTRAQKEIRGYLQDLYEAAGFNAKGSISSEDFFDLKKMVNEDYQGVYKKLMSNTPLSDREKVIQVARNVFDAIIAKEHPTVKEMTVMQSHLFDAAGSLSRGRDAVPTNRIMGTTVPTPIIKAGEDLVGRGAQAVGRGVETVKQAGMAAGEAVGPAVGAVRNPIIATGIGALGEESGQNPQDQEQQITAGDNGNGDQDNNQQDLEHDSSVAQIDNTVTGYTVKELGMALTQARLNGDSAAVKDLKAMYDMEVAYQDKQSKQTKATKKTEAQQAREDTAMLATKAISQLKGGKVQTGFLFAPLEEAKGVLGKGDKPTLEFNNTITQIKATIAKARAGTSFTPNEEKLLNKYTPKIGDSKQVLEIKLAALEDFFARYTNVVPDSSVNIDIGGMSTDNATGE